MSERRVKLHRFDDGRCKHGGMSKTVPREHVCALGVDVRKHVGGPDFGWGVRIPCVITGLSRDVVPCARYEEYTEAEKQARDKEMNRFVDSVMSGKSPCHSAPLIAQGTGRFCSTCNAFVARFCGEGDMHL